MHTCTCMCMKFESVSTIMAIMNDVYIYVNSLFVWQTEASIGYYNLIEYWPQSNNWNTMEPLIKDPLMGQPLYKGHFQYPQSV